MSSTVLIIASIIGIALQIYLWVLVARAVVGFIPLFKPDWRPRGALLVVVEFVFVVTDPPVKFFGRLIPPLRIGAFALDFGYLLTFVAVIILQLVVNVVTSFILQALAN